MDKKRFRHFLDHVELFVDRSIPFLIIILLGIIIIEFFYPVLSTMYHLELSIIDGTIIFVFVVDLIFKYFHIRNIPRFLKHFWLDILAVFPFFLMFRVFESLASIWEIGEITERSQKLLHEGLEIEKEGAKIVQEVEKAGRIRRATLFGRVSRFIRPITRIPRILKIIPYHTRKKIVAHHSMLKSNNGRKIK